MNAEAFLLDNARTLTLFYLKCAVDLDLQKRFKIKGFETSSIHWIVAHLAWAQYYLITGKGSGVEWLNYFRIGADYAKSSNFPPFNETLVVFNQIHKNVIEQIKTINDAVLGDTNHVNLEFSTGGSKKMMISHCIRHEGYNFGQLGWLIRMQSGKVF